MKRWIELGVFLMLFAVPGLARAQASPADEATIKDLARQYDALWNAGEGVKAAALYTDDATLINHRGIEVNGRAAIAKGFAEESVALKGTTGASTVDTIRFIQPGLALVHGNTRITGGKMPAEGYQSHWLAVITKRSGSWRILAIHSAAMGPAPPSQE